MSVKEQNEMLEMLVACGSSEDDALDTVIMMLESDDDIYDDQHELQEDLLLEFQECY